MNELHCIMPMAGLGTRTKDISCDPKPFIMIAGVPLFRYGLNGMPLSRSGSLTYVLNSRDKGFCEDSGFALLEAFTPRDIAYEIVFTSTTSGQAETVSKAIIARDIQGQILIGNSDTLVSNDVPEDLDHFEGALGFFRSSNPGMSYLRQVDGLVVETAEKVVISNQASSGIYYFRSSSQFMDMLGRKATSGESYVAPLYNELILRNGEVSCWEHDFVQPLGTGSEILGFLDKIKDDSSVLATMGIQKEPND